MATHTNCDSSVIKTKLLKNQSVCFNQKLKCFNCNHVPALEMRERVLWLSGFGVWPKHSCGKSVTLADSNSKADREL